jgi:hypothetical protein
MIKVASPGPAVVTGAVGVPVAGTVVLLETDRGLGTGDKTAGFPPERQTQIRG